jgi:cytosine/adenosine deaminase-related metal-dependent hydrolase
MMGEVRQALLLNRLAVSPGIGSGPQMTARQALTLATVAGARVLGREDIGVLSRGRCADLIAYDVDRIEFAGARHDPVAALVMCAPVTVDHSWVGGRRVVEDGNLVALDVPDLVAEHNRLAATLL